MRLDHVRFPSGKIGLREVVEHQPAAAVLAVDNDGYIYFVLQYRHAVDEVLYEIPAGLPEKGESVAEAAVRELQEEIGRKPRVLREISTLYSSPGFSDERVILFYAEDLELSKLPQDDDEHIEVVKLTLDEAIELIGRGQIKDGKTIAAIFWYGLQKATGDA